jgi:hypothetical protein
VPGDDEGAANPGEVSREAFRHAVDEGVVIGVTAEVGKGEHDNRQAGRLAVRGERRRGQDDRWRRLLRRLARGRFPDRADEAKPLAGRGADEPLRLAAVADGASRRIDPAGQGRFRDHPAVPDGFDKLVLADDAAAIGDEKR